VKNFNDRAKVFNAASYCLFYYHQTSVKQKFDQLSIKTALKPANLQFYFVQVL
jgi:hypothetical protein